tara:strand:- start:174 stop:449 length:276 start_codon:yes stop_codon:yes gene_type:complete
MRFRLSETSSAAWNKVSSSYSYFNTTEGRAKIVGWVLKAQEFIPFALHIYSTANLSSISKLRVAVIESFIATHDDGKRCRMPTNRAITYTE